LISLEDYEVRFKKGDLKRNAIHPKFIEKKEPIVPVVAEMKEEIFVPVALELKEETVVVVEAEKKEEIAVPVVAEKKEEIVEVQTN